MKNKSWTPAHLATLGAKLTTLPDVALHWTEMRAVKDKIADLMVVANVALANIEDDPQLTPQGKQAKAAALGKETAAKIEAATDSATKAADRRIQALEAKLSTVIEKPADPAVAAEIRRYVATSKSPVLTAMAQKHDPVIVSALVHAPSILSGLTPADVDVLRREVLNHTAEQKEILQIKDGLKVVSDAVRSAAGMITQRAGARELPTLRPPEPAKV